MKDTHPSKGLVQGFKDIYPAEGLVEEEKLLRRHGWLNFSIHFSQIGELPETLCMVSFQGKPASPTLGGCRLKKPEKPKTLGGCRLKGPGLSSAIPFWIISGPWVPRRSKLSVLVPYWTISDHCGKWEQFAPAYKLLPPRN